MCQTLHREFGKPDECVWDVISDLNESHSQLQLHLLAANLSDGLEGHRITSSAVRTVLHPLLLLSRFEFLVTPTMGQEKAYTWDS